MLTLTPVSLAQANAFVAQHHRHHKPVTGHKFSIGCTADGQQGLWAIRKSSLTPLTPKTVQVYAPPGGNAQGLRAGSVGREAAAPPQTSLPRN